METVVRLKKGEFWKGSYPKGGTLEIKCLEGALWITQEGDDLDYCLEQNENYLTNSSQKVLLESLEENSQLILRCSRGDFFSKSSLIASP